MTTPRMRQRLVRTVLRIYPRWWRERYGEELGDLLDSESSLSVGVFFDVLRSAILERLASGLAWQIGLTALLALGPFLVSYYYVPGWMKWGDPVLSLIVESWALVDLWLTPLLIAVFLALVLRWTAGPTGSSLWVRGWCAISCAVTSHAVLLLSNSSLSLLVSATWWREVYPQVFLLYAGFGVIGFVAHCLIVALPPSKGMAAER